MKFAVALVAFATSALAQHIEIGAPKNFAAVKAGSKITVEVDRPVRPSLAPSCPLFRVFCSSGLAVCAQNSLTGSTEVGIAIGLWPCGGPKGTSKCASTDVSQVLGNELGGIGLLYRPSMARPGSVLAAARHASPISGDEAHRIIRAAIAEHNAALSG